jgi:hypothetical protein
MNFLEKTRHYIMILPIEIVDYIVSLTDLETAVRCNNKYAIRKLYNKERHTIEWAVINNKLDVLKYLVKSTNETIKPYLFIDAIWLNHFSVAEYLIDLLIKDTERPFFTNYIIEECCCYRCDLETVMFLEKYNIVFNQNCIDLICGSSDVETVSYLLIKGYKISHKSIQNAVYYGKIDIFEYIKNEFTDLSEDEPPGYGPAGYDPTGVGRPGGYSSFEYGTRNLIDIACDNSQLEMMKHLYYNYNLRGSRLIMEKAILTRSGSIISWVARTHRPGLRLPQL